MRVLITGGAGFIGSHVADACMAAGHTVSVVDDLSCGKRSNVPDGAAFYEIDIRSDGLAGVFSELAPEVVLHQAAQMNVTYSVEQPQVDASINVLGSVNVLQQCVRHKVRKIIYASSAGAVYGEPTALPVTEETVPKPISHYGASKLAIEHYLHVYSYIYGLTYTILRYGNVYGPRQLRHGEAGVVPILLDALRKGTSPKLYGMGEPVRDYVYVGDVARANMAALEKGHNDCFNVSTGRGTSVRELYGHLMRLTSLEVEPELHPLRSGEVLSIITSPAKAGGGLNWRAEVGLSEGLDATIQSFEADATKL